MPAAVVEVALVVLLVFLLVVLILLMQRRHLQKTGSERARQPRGLGGWLVLPAIGMFLLPVHLLAYLYFDCIPLFRGGYWDALTTPGEKTYHPLWAAVIIYDLAGNLVFLLFDLVLLYLFFTKSRRFPALVMVFLICCLVFASVGYSTLDLIHAAQREHLVRARGLFVTMISAMIWIPYFLMSRRVKNTFVNPRTYKSSGEIAQGCG